MRHKLSYLHIPQFEVARCYGKSRGWDRRDWRFTAVCCAWRWPVSGAVVHKLIAATTWDVKVYEPSGPGAWSPDYTWASQVHEIMGEELGFDILVLPDNHSVLSLVESDTSAPNFGQAQLHYRW
jgi:hypothetical protein